MCWINQVELCTPDLSNTWFIQHIYGEQMLSGKPEPTVYSCQGSILYRIEILGGRLFSELLISCRIFMFVGFSEMRLILKNYLS